MKSQQPDAADAAVSRDGDVLVFRGALVRAAIAALWRQVQPLRAGIARLDLGAVSAVDSAGLALLTELANGYPAATGRGSPVGAGSDVRVDGIAITGAPAGLAELRAAYRLDDRLAVAR